MRSPTQINPRTVARAAAALAAGRTLTAEQTKQLNLILAALGQRSGAAGGHKAASHMTKAERSARARKAAAARYAKKEVRGAKQ